MYLIWFSPRIKKDVVLDLTHFIFSLASNQVLSIHFDIYLMFPSIFCILPISLIDLYDQDGIPGRI